MLKTGIELINMEPTQKGRGKYKKHREGFKVAVEYKLNAKLKGLETFDGQNLYPVYVEVRAKRKRHYFPSFYSFYVLPEEFDQFKANELVKTLFINESESIISFVTEHYNDPANENESNWYQSYKVLSENDNIGLQLKWLIEHSLYHKFTGKIFDMNRIVDVLMFTKGDYVQNTLDLLVPMKTVNPNPMIQELIDVLRTYLRIKEFLSLHSREWLAPELRVIFHLEYSISLPILKKNALLRNRIKLIGYQSDRFFSDVDILDEFVNSVKIV